jgi:IclR family transcriptional regulator, KDG regulon repressor
MCPGSRESASKRETGRPANSTVWFRAAWIGPAGAFGRGLTPRVRAQYKKQRPDFYTMISDSEKNLALEAPEDSSTLLTVVRAFIVLEALSNEREAGVTDLARKTGFNRSAVHRLLATLEHLGYVQQSTVTSKYFLSARLFAIGSRGPGTRGLRELGGPLARQLSQETGESVYLGIRDDGGVVHIDGYLGGESSLRYHPLLGERVPVHCTALGKAIIAFLPDDERRHAMSSSGLRRFTPSTLVEIEVLERDLAQTRQRGYSLNNEEGAPGNRSVAAPIRDASGTVFAALCLGASTEHLSVDDLHRLGPRVQQVGDEISSRLGYFPSVSEGRVRALAS